jgi:hypothetical protein
MGFVESVVVMCLDEEDVWIGGGKKREFCRGGVEIKIKLAWSRSL